MHISPCEHPKRIKNPYTGEDLIVPCGKCNTCRNNRQRVWVQRLEQEMSCWRYTLFFTLTYDERNVPRAYVHNNSIIMDTSTRHCCPNGNTLFIDLNEFSRNVAPLTDKDWDYVERRPYFDYLSVYDVQCFMKRLRINMKRCALSYDYLNEKDYKIRYYIAGEYGSTTLRPHYHGLLFFNSEFQASHIIEMLHKSWTFGNIDASFPESSAASYVAKYVNCLANLPTFYQHRQIRPFSLCSRCPSLGTLFANDAEIQDLFYRCSPTRVIYDSSSNSFRDVPEWRTLVDRLYPKIKGFSSLSHFDRITLYRLAEISKQDTWSEFLYFCQKGKFKQDWLNRYLAAITNNYTLLSPLQFIWTSSHRIMNQCRVWNMDISKYVEKIELFYNNMEIFKINNMYNFEEQYCKDRPACELLGINALFLDDIKDLDLHEVTISDLNALESYGVDVDLFFSPLLEIREEYQSKLLPSNTPDFKIMEMQNAIIVKNSMKTKKKNDFIAAHPEKAVFVFNS